MEYKHKGNFMNQKMSEEVRLHATPKAILSTFTQRHTALHNFMLNEAVISYTAS